MNLQRDISHLSKVFKQYVFSVKSHGCTVTGHTGLS